MIQRDSPFDIRQEITRIFRPVGALLALIFRPFMPVLRPLISILSDERVRQVLGQLIFVAILIFFFWLVGTTASSELRQKGPRPHFQFPQFAVRFRDQREPGMV